MKYSADLACMAPVPEDLFVEACERAVAGNLEFVPPYGSGGALYLRPLLLGTGPEIGLFPAPEFTFLVMVIPVGNFYKSGVKPVDCLVVDNFDRGKEHEYGDSRVYFESCPSKRTDQFGKRDQKDSLCCQKS